MRTTSLLATIALIFGLEGFPASLQSQTGKPVYLNPDLPLEQRVQDLVSRLTLEEKISQMVHDAAAVERLGIPNYNWWNESLHGVARAGVATVFPQAIGLAATWNAELMHKVATVISDEARAKNNDFVRRGVREIYTGLTFWSPNINIFRDPRWGRGQETYGEDPYLTARMGVAFVKGLQGDDPRYLKLVSTPKHFAVHSGPEPDRHRFDARVSDRDLRETFLPAFEACVREGKAYSVMGAYNRTNGEACCASTLLLENILRKEWGFKGYVVSDCGAIWDIYQTHKLVKTAEEAAALAVKRGCDLNCGQTYTALLDAVKKGLIDERTITRSVERLYAARFRLGQFDPPERVPFTQIPSSVVNSPEHRALALRAARESIVLLKNERGLLPLGKDLKSVAVIGPNADDLGVLLGNYNGTPARAVTPLEGIRNKVGSSTIVYSARGCDIAPGVPGLSVIPSAHLRPKDADAGQVGLQGAYYSTPALDGKPKFVRVDPVVNMTWKDAPPLGGYPTDDFSVRWTGWLVPPVSGTYILAVSAVSGYAMFLDGEELFPFLSSEHHAFTRTKEIQLEAGRLYALRIDYVNTGRDPQIQLLWAKPGGDPGAEAIEIAQKAEVVVLVMGLSPSLEGEEMPVQVEGFAGGDRTDIRLPRTQEQLLKKIHALGKPVVLVLLSGSALAVNWAQENVLAIIEAWYPGEAGGTAIADVLFGDYNPAGRLPVTFYNSIDQLPPFDDYNMKGRTYRYMTQEPLYPFGHGLSYTRFDYAQLQIQPAQIKSDGVATVSVDIRNAGDREGDEVVQLYVRYPNSKVTRPIKDLKGFQRIMLKPGQTRNVSFTLTARQLAYYGKDGFVVEPGKVHVMLGSSSANIRLMGEINVLR